MKYFKIINTIIVCLFLTNISVGQTTIKSIYQQGREAAKLIEEKGLEVVHIEYDILSSSSTTKSLQRSLSANYEYLLIAFSTDDITDLDIKLYKDIPNDWEFIDEQDSEGNFATVSVTPDSTKTYLIKVYANQFKQYQSAGYYGLLIAHGSKSDKADYSELSNLGISTNETQYGVYEDEEIKINNTVETSTLFSFNKKLTQFIHKTETISSTYFINSKEYDASNNTYTLGVMSDAGNKYTYMINLENKTITALIVKDDKIRLVIFKIKNFWKND